MNPEILHNCPPGTKVAYTSAKGENKYVAIKFKGGRATSTYWKALGTDFKCTYPTYDELTTEALAKKPNVRILELG